MFARDVVGALAHQVMNAFARLILRACRGNLEDVNQGGSKIMDPHLYQICPCTWWKNVHVNILEFTTKWMS
jgi:hypothetical protein